MRAREPAPFWRENLVAVITLLRVLVAEASYRLLIKYWKFCHFALRTGGGGEGTPLYKLYRYVPPHRVGFLRRFGLKTGIHFAHFGLESGMVFEGTTGVYERIYRFNSK